MSDLGFCRSCGGNMAMRSIYGRDRGQCSACGWIAWEPPTPVVIALASTSTGKVLYARRSSWPAGHWGLISGYVEQGETVEAAALREVEEESSLAGRNPRIIASAPWRDELLVCVALEIDEQQPRPTDPNEEVVELAGADPSRIPEGYPAHQFLAQWIASRGAEVSRT